VPLEDQAAAGGPRTQHGVFDARRSRAFASSSTPATPADAATQGLAAQSARSFAVRSPDRRVLPEVAIAERCPTVRVASFGPSRRDVPSDVDRAACRPVDVAELAADPATVGAVPTNITNATRNRAIRRTLTTRSLAINCFGTATGLGPHAMLSDR
jgi:hypothetical protein